MNRHGSERLAGIACMESLSSSVWDRAHSSVPTGPTAGRGRLHHGLDIEIAERVVPGARWARRASERLRYAEVCSFVVLRDLAMPCLEMKELQARCDKYAERRHTATGPERERRKFPLGSCRLGQFRVAYLIHAHRMNCDVLPARSLRALGCLISQPSKTELKLAPGCPQSDRWAAG
jgi:hypothetical protein